MLATRLHSDKISLPRFLGPRTEVTTDTKEIEFKQPRITRMARIEKDQAEIGTLQIPIRGIRVIRG